MSSWWHRRSVRVRLTVWYAGALAAVLAVYAGGVFLFLRHSLVEELDHQLREDFEIAEGMLERSSDGGIQWRTEEHEDEDAEMRWVEVWSPQGVPLYRSAAVAAGRTATATPPVGDGYTSSTLANAGRMRALSAPATIAGTPVVIRVARSEDRLHQELNELLLVLGIGFPIAVGLAGVGGYGLARRALAPVGRMAERAKTITAERLGERLPVDNPDDELGQLARVFNDAFARLERSFDQLRRFTADASHELRTPLTAIRSVGEVGLREPREAAAYREVIGSMLEEADRLASLVDTLLTLSRADAAPALLKRERIDLAELAREVANHLGVLAEEKHQVIAVEPNGRADTVADPVVLRQAVVNLVDNAIKYSPAGGRVRIVTGNRAGAPTLEVIDTGPGIPREHQAHVFDRFYRVDRARSRALGGAGLGLSIARWAVEAHGGRIELESEEGMGATFRIRLKGD